MTNFLVLLLILALGTILTMKVIPFLFVRFGRLLGFRMQMNPFTKKREALFYIGTYNFFIVFIAL